MPPENQTPNAPAEAPAEAPGLTVPVEPAAPAPVSNQRTPGDEPFFTAEDIARVRKEEKDKLYPRMDSMQAELQELRSARESEKAALEAAEAAKVEAARLQTEADMEVRELLQTKEQEWQSRFDAMQEELAQREAIAEREREMQALEGYRSERLAQNADNIMPELMDLVRGSSQEEIDQSIEDIVGRTSSIMGQVQQQHTQMRMQMQGTKPTAPPMGPVEENDSTQQTFTAEQIRSMPMNEYAKYRDKLKNAASDRIRQSGPYGR